MPDLLSSRLQVTDLRPVDSRSVLVRAARAGASTQAIDARKGQEIAGSFAADYFVLGSIVEVGGKLHISAALYTTASEGEALVRTAVSGNTDQVFALADSAGAVLLRAASAARRVAKSIESSGAGTRSLDALRDYTAGEIAFTQARFADAAAAFASATRADPTFARAWFRLSMASIWAPGAGIEGPLAQARRHADRLTPDERVLLEAWRAHTYALPATADSLYRTYLASHPYDAEAWFQLAEVRMHWGSSLGIPAAEAAQAFQRALELFPENAAALVHLIRLAGRAGDSASVAMLSDQLLALGPAQRERDEAHLIRALAGARADTTAVATAYRATTPDGILGVRGELPQLAASIPRPGDVSVVWRRFGFDATAPGENAMFSLSGQAEAAAGRVSDAMEATRRLPSPLLPRGVELRALYAVLPFGAAQPARDARVLDDLRRLPATKSADSVGHRDAMDDVFLPRRVVLDALLSMRLGDTAQAERQAVALETYHTRPSTVAFARPYAALIRARLSMARGDPSHALSLLGVPAQEPLGQYPHWSSWPKALERWTRAEALLALDRPAEALRWLDGFPDNTGYDIVFAAPAQLLAVRAELRLGRPPAAAARLARASAMWLGAGAEQQVMLATTRRQIDEAGKRGPTT
jgi:tetratricopeptide (TPR) repeat protein